MNDDDELKKYTEWDNPAVPRLRGWSPGDEDRPIPGLELTDEDWELAKKSWRQPADAASRQVGQEELHTEFTLYYGKTGARHIARDRRYNQVRHAATLISEMGAPLVLMTNDFKVFRAKGIWSLIWIYFKVKILGIKKPKGPKKRPLPKYDHV